MKDYILRILCAIINKPYSGDSHHYGVLQAKHLSKDFLETIQGIEERLMKNKKNNVEYEVTSANKKEVSPEEKERLQKLVKDILKKAKF